MRSTLRSAVVAGRRLTSAYPPIWRVITVAELGLTVVADLADLRGSYGSQLERLCGAVVVHRRAAHAALAGAPWPIPGDGPSSARHHGSGALVAVDQRKGILDALL
jgi:hypothetical protein